MSRFNSPENRFVFSHLRRYWKWVLSGLFALCVVDVLEIIPPLLIKEAVDAIGGASSAKFAGQVGWASYDVPKKLFLLSLAYLGISAVQSIGRYAWRVLLIRGSLFAGRDLRQDFAVHLYKMSASFYDRWKVGDLLSHAVTDVEAIRMALGAGVLMAADALIYLVMIPAAMFWLSPSLTWVALAPLLLIPWLVLRSEREIRRRFEGVQQGQGEISSFVQERLYGLRVIKGFGKEEVQSQQLSALGEEQKKRSLFLARVQSTFAPSLDLVMSLGGVLLLVVGGNWVVQGTITLGVFVAFTRYIQKMVWPMTAIGMSMGHYQRAITSASRILAVQAEKTDVPQSSSPKLPELSGVNSDIRPTGWKTPGKVELRRLDFAFAGGPQVLDQIDLVIQPGERIAFVGRVGSGKSALLAILPRLYPVSDGMVWIDGVDINHWDLNELRLQVGFVGQDAFLFSESILENVAVGLGRQQQVPQAPIFLATERASLHQEIMEFEGNYQNILGERGLNLSGGQKQRLTIARALVREPSILILDDALSAVDVATEEKILKELRSRPGRNTELIAAHRISSIQEADRIVVLERGKIVQQGTHAELLRSRSGLYRRFYDTQSRSEDLEQYLQEVPGLTERRAEP